LAVYIFKIKFIILIFKIKLILVTEPLTW
jgi:hypothetical protein